MADQKISALTSLAQADIAAGTDVLPIVDVGAPSVTKKSTPQAIVGASVNDLAQTWNAGGTTFTAVKMNVTDTASAAASLLLDLQTGGASRFNITKGGTIYAVGVDLSTTQAADSIGTRGVPQNSKSADYTLVAADAGQHILHSSSDNNARTFTIPANGSVAYPVGTVITFINLINTLTIAINSDTMTLANSSTTGSRTLAVNGIATAIKVASTSWLISGTGLT